MLKKLVLYSLLLTCFLAIGQSAVGQWNAHIPFNKGKKLTDAGNKIYIAAEPSMFVYDKTDKTTTNWTKVEGLSDIGVSVVKYSKAFNTLIVAYENANLDLIIGNRVINVPDINRYPLIGNKTIHEIFIKDELAYLACGFGIVVFDIERREIKDTYYIGNNSSYVNVQDITIYNDTIYAATEEGVYFASTYAGNLADFNFWTKDNTMGSKSYNSIVTFEDLIIINQNNEGWEADSLHYYNGSWNYWDIGFTIDVHDINTSDEHVLIAGNYAHYFFSGIDSLDFNIYTLGSVGPQPREIIVDEEGVIWSADNVNGLVRSTGPWSHTIIKPIGPDNADAVKIRSSNDKVYVAAGAMSDTWNSTWSRKGFHKYVNNKWSSHNMTSFPGLENDTIWDIIDIAIDPANDEHVFLSSWGRGLVEIQNGVAVNVFREHNSLVSPVEGISYYDVRIGGIMFDRNSNLWIANTQNSNFLLVKSNEDWYEFNFNNDVGKNHLGGELIASKYNNYVYVQLGRGGGLLAFDYGSSFDDTSDDNYAHLTSAIGNGGLPNNEVKCIAEDKDGELWVGTSEGIAVFYDPGSLFTNSPQDAQTILVNFEGHWQNLLEADEVLDIYVDGGNRKWIATSGSGVFLLSEDGTEEIYHFTKENSPLFSNKVLSIGINEESGEVFFATDKGVISFRGDATLGEENFGGTYAFPNPVKPGYNGIITITGLVENSIVKITDISGNVIFETQANGGTATWDGNSLNGDRAASGVYLVFAADENGEQAIATKILFVN